MMNSSSSIIESLVNDDQLKSSMCVIIEIFASESNNLSKKSDVDFGSTLSR